MRPLACPTLSASSGVITALARPRIPSVPKYLRTMFPRRLSPSAGYINAFAVGCASKIFVNVTNRRNPLLTLSLCRRLAAWRLRAKSSSRPALVAGAGRRLGHRDRIRNGRRVLQSSIELLIELLLAFGLPLPALCAFVFGMWRQFGAVWPQRSVLVPFFHHGGSPVRPGRANNRLTAVKSLAPSTITPGNRPRSLADAH